MAGMQIQGGVPGTGFDRFRALRDQAQQRLRRTDVETRLQAAIQNQRAAGPASASNSTQASPPSTANMSVSGQYVSAGALEKPDPKPALGQILDILA